MRLSWQRHRAQEKKKRKKGHRDQGPTGFGNNLMPLAGVPEGTCAAAASGHKGPLPALRAPLWGSVRRSRHGRGASQRDADGYRCQRSSSHFLTGLIAADRRFHWPRFTGSQAPETPCPLLPRVGGVPGFPFRHQDRFYRRSTGRCCHRLPRARDDATEQSGLSVLSIRKVASASRNPHHGRFVLQVVFHVSETLPAEQSRASWIPSLRPGQLPRLCM